MAGGWWDVEEANASPEGSMDLPTHGSGRNLETPAVPLALLVSR